MLILNDNLPVYREASFCSPLAALGIRTSYMAPLNPRGNGLAERFVRTLKDFTRKLHG